MPSIDVAAALHAGRHAAGQPDAVTPASIGAVDASRWLTGTGSPEGVLAVPVGVRYTDETATFGAVEWVKAVGTGSTGWAVSHGDTGDVDVTAQCTIAGAAPIAGDSVIVRRITTAALVFDLSLASRSSWPSPTIVTLPSWAISGPIRSLASAGPGTPSRLSYAGGVLPELRFYSLVGGAGVSFAETSAPATAAIPWRSS